MINQIKEMLVSCFGTLLKVFIGELKGTTKKETLPQMSFLLTSLSAANWPYSIDIKYIPKTAHKDGAAALLELPIAHYQGQLDSTTSFTFPLPHTTMEGTPCPQGSRFKLFLEIKRDANTKRAESARTTIEWTYNEGRFSISSFESSAGAFCFFKESIINPATLSLQVSNCITRPEAD
jgi:hypothetical protein